MKSIIEQIARENSVTAGEVEADMKEAIHQAYLTGTPAFRAMFGNREPDVEEFIRKMALKIKNSPAE